MCTNTNVSFGEFVKWGLRGKAESGLMNFMGHEQIYGKILIVDDTPANLSVLLDDLSRAHLQVFIAESGERALVQVGMIKPDVILLDVMMPGLDGFETLKRLKASLDTKDIPVILMTALSDIVDKVKGFELGAVDYITKPFQQEELEARIRTHLRLHRLQQALEDANRTLLKENENKNILFSLIAHDVRAPLNSISFAVDALVRYGDRADKAQILDQISNVHQSTQQLAEMTEDLLHWAQIQMHGRICDPKILNLHEIARMNMDLFKIMAEDKAIKLRNDIPKKTAIFADRDMIDSVIRNLLSNAIKFTPAGGTVTIDSSKKDKMIEFTVHDTGVGIEKDKLEKLFKVETRFSTPGTQNEKGSGLGLILCRDMVEANHGKIWAQSIPKKGSHFTVSLPSEEPLAELSELGEV